MNTGHAPPPDEPAVVFYVGHHDPELTTPIDIDTLYRAQDLGYDFVATPITNSSFDKKVITILKDSYGTPDESKSMPLPAIPPLGREDTSLVPSDSNSSLIAMVSPWIDLDSPDPDGFHVSRQVLNLEVAYAAFCGINHIIVKAPKGRGDITQFARAIREALGLGPFIHIHVLFQMTGDLETDNGEHMHLSRTLRASVAEDEGLYDTWDAWNTIRTVCNYSPKLSIALEIPRHLPSFSIQSRWYSEPVRLLILPYTGFLHNAKGYPVLSKPGQQLLSRFARLRFPPWILLSDIGPIPETDLNVAEGQSPEPTPAEAASKAKEKPKDPSPHLRYLRHLQHNQAPRRPIERFGNGYQDYLQSPLQPLTDNLESITYEVFEKDPVKYDWYERAIASALRDLVTLINEPKEIIVAVVGAGRGPLVTRALQASQKTGIAIKCWAVEKNPNALVLLQRRNATDQLWKGEVHVVKSDMRHWDGPTISGVTRKVDIIVSELLGSFADNELSPECLDGVQHTLHPDHGISIPQSYSAHISPISTPVLYGDLLSRTGPEKWELPYVVLLQQYDYLCTLGGEERPDTAQVPDVKQAWSFSHPVKSTLLEYSKSRAGGRNDAGGWVGGDGSNEHNARASKVPFKCRKPGLCHGLAGYFETVLYAGTSGKVELSTNPLTMDEKSKDMISWFPIFFPLKVPLYMPQDSDVQVHMWRQTDDRTVWYEWIVEVFEEEDRGRKRRIAISELHSSRKNGCVM